MPQRTPESRRAGELSPANVDCCCSCVPLLLLLLENEEEEGWRSRWWRASDLVMVGKGGDRLEKKKQKRPRKERNRSKREGKLLPKKKKAIFTWQISSLVPTIQDFHFFLIIVKIHNHTIMYTPLIKYSSHKLFTIFHSKLKCH